ncbi:B3 domain-containing protein REM20-like [Capsella rubella]|uniref:B3 domain-containing protein REM20-like n=1 Tax=Capsella rubella TaxID=81985 RepID=UPI000CD4CF60|nr:B3 domain-containing protein REM20-like [Capsella rubella]
MKKEVFVTEDFCGNQYPRFFRIFKNKSCQQQVVELLSETDPRERNQKGETWSIPIKTVMNKVFLDDGWKSFAQRNELKHGNCLIYLSPSIYSLKTELIPVLVMFFAYSLSVMYSFLMLW